MYFHFDSINLHQQLTQMTQPVELPWEIDLVEKVGEIHLIIVDDDPLFSLMLQDYLIENEMGNSEIFSSGEDFLRKYKATDRRRIILDFEFIEGPDGLEVLQRIKKINPLAEVIVVSALDNLEKALETIRKGAMDYFLKSNTTVFANILCSLIKLRDLENQRLN